MCSITIGAKSEYASRLTGSMLESKGMRAIFQKKCKKMLKKGTKGQNI